MRHLKKHGSLADGNAEYFNRKANIVSKARLDSCGSCQQNNISAIEVLYLVAQRIVKAKKKHIMAGELVLPCTKDIVSIMI
jgi:hypothetical protein